MASWAVELFGKELLTKDGIKATDEVVVGKKAVSSISLHIGAHHAVASPPC